MPLLTGSLLMRYWGHGCEAPSDSETSSGQALVNSLHCCMSCTFPASAILSLPFRLCSVPVLLAVAAKSPDPPELEPGSTEQEQEQVAIARILTDSFASSAGSRSSPAVLAHHPAMAQLLPLNSPRQPPLRRRGRQRRRGGNCRQRPQPPVFPSGPRGGAGGPRGGAHDGDRRPSRLPPGGVRCGKRHASCHGASGWPCGLSGRHPRCHAGDGGGRDAGRNAWRHAGCRAPV